MLSIEVLPNVGSGGNLVLGPLPGRQDIGAEEQGLGVARGCGEVERRRGRPVGRGRGFLGAGGSQGREGEGAAQETLCLSHVLMCCVPKGALRRTRRLRKSRAFRNPGKSLDSTRHPPDYFRFSLQVSCDATKKCPNPIKPSPYTCVSGKPVGMLRRRKTSR
jgi:hypothetical protein